MPLYQRAGTSKAGNLIADRPRHSHCCRRRNVRYGSEVDPPRGLKPDRSRESINFTSSTSSEGLNGFATNVAPAGRSRSSGWVTPETMMSGISGWVLATNWPKATPSRLGASLRRREMRKRKRGYNLAAKKFGRLDPPMTCDDLAVVRHEHRVCKPEPLDGGCNLLDLPLRMRASIAGIRSEHRNLTFDQLGMFHQRPPASNSDRVRTTILNACVRQ